jgi:hypothetical protein
MPMRTTSLIIVILILLIFFWPTEPAQLDRDSSQTLRTGPGPTAEIQNSRVAKSGATRIIRGRSKNQNKDGEFDPYEEWELSKILSHFMVPPDEFRAGSINDSITRLKAIYLEHSGHNLEISLDAPVHPNEAIAFNHDNISFRTLLGMVAGLSGYSVNITNREIAFTTIQPAPQRSEIVQSSPLALSDDRMEEILNTPEKTREYLTSLGLHTPEIFGFPDDQSSCKNLITSLEDARLDPENFPRQVGVQNKFIEFPPGFEFEPTEMSDTELQLAMRDWSQLKGIDILTAPWIVALPGQEAKIEIGKEILYPDPQQTDQINTEFQGRRITVNPVLAGLDRIQFGSEVAIHTVETRNPHEYTQDSFHAEITESEVHLIDGISVLIPITGDDGATTIQIFTPQRIDATGKRFWPPEPE